VSGGAFDPTKLKKLGGLTDVLGANTDFRQCVTGSRWFTCTTMTKSIGRNNLCDAKNRTHYCIVGTYLPTFWLIIYLLRCNIDIILCELFYSIFTPGRSIFIYFHLAGTCHIQNTTDSCSYKYIFLESAKCSQQNWTLNLFIPHIYFFFNSSWWCVANVVMQHNISLRVQDNKEYKFYIKILM